MHLRTSGLGAHDLDLELSPLVLLSAANGQGKSTLSNALRIAALGFVPSLGRREADTAQLMNGRELSVTLTLDDGRVIERTLRVDAKGRLSLATRCSWIDQGTSEEHAAAATACFGADAQSVAEALDLRELLALSGPQRAARIEALIQTQADPAALAQALGRYTLQRLADVADDRMPDDHTALRPLVDGYSEDGEHAGQYAALVAGWPMIKAKLAEGGLAAAAAHVNERKRQAATAVRNARQARAELEQRLQETPEPDAEEIARLEVRRGELEQAIGATRERSAQVEQQAGRIVLADRQLARAQTALTAALTARQVFETEAADRGQIEAELAQVDAEIAALGEAPAGGEEPAALLALRDEIAALEAERAALPVPMAPPSLTEHEATIARLQARLEAAHGSPWATVRTKAAAIRELSARIPKAKPISVLADELQALAATQADDVDAVEAELGAARAALVDAQKQVAAANASATRHVRRRGDIEASLGDLRERLAGEESAWRSARDIAGAEYRGALNRLRTSRQQLAAALAAFEPRDRATAAAVTEARAALAAAEQVRAGLGDPPDQVEAAGAELTDELARTRAQLATMLDAQARHRELAATVADIARREAEAVVFSAVEDAVKRVRADEVGRQGGPLVAALDRYLKAAGRAEAPYVRAERASCDFGWRVPSTGAEVSIATMSGGEWTMFGAGLLAAILALRGAAVRPLLIEAAECDQQMLGQLLAGIAGVADGLSLAVVATPHPPGPLSVIREAGWTVMSPAGRVLDLSRAA